MTLSHLDGYTCQQHPQTLRAHLAGWNRDLSAGWWRDAVWYCWQSLREADLTSERLDRRLSAILAADVAGYSRLMGLDEEGTLAQLKNHRVNLIDPKIAEHRGRIVRTTGDGMLAEFASAVDAARCAVDIQLAMASANLNVAATKRVELRIGIHVGDIISDDGDIFGDGVNIAARLEGLAEPGGICVSARVQEDVEGRLDVVFKDGGEQQLKNIARPVRIYKIQIGRPEAAEDWRRRCWRFPASPRSRCCRSRT